MYINSFKTNIQPTFTANVMPKNCAEFINNKLTSAKTVDIFCHTASDEDAFNSAKAMYSYLESQGIKSRIIASNAKECYQYDTQKYNIIETKDINEKTQKADLALCVDFSSPTRALPNVLKYIQSYGNNIVGFDHHNDNDKITKNYNHITSAYQKTQDMPALEGKNYYIDSSAKSNCAIISRFFDAIGHKVNKEEAKSLYTGMLDDTCKDGISKVSYVSGNVKINNEKANDFKHTKEVFDNVAKNLNILDKLNIYKHFINKSKLTPEDINFQKGLDKRVNYSDNGKFAYIAISNNDTEWENLGKDNNRTKKVLNDFRKDTLNKNKNIDAVAVFYPTNTENTYKMSILTRNDYAKQIIDNIKTTNPDIVAGGHENRSGGTIVTDNEQEYNNWVNLFKTSADKVLK